MKTWKTWIYLLLIFFSPELLAGPFDPVATDKSRELLGVIFGSNVGDIYLGGSQNPVLRDMMEKFNFIIVVIGAVVVSYVAIMSTINTAQEGTAMGKKWSAVWIPMRSVAGMAMMIPAPASGYSMIQVTVMWIVLQGIGAADALWNIALDGLAKGVSASAGTVSHDRELKPTGLLLAKDILNATICMEALRQAANNTENQNANSWLAQKGQLIKMYDNQDKTTPNLTGQITTNAAGAVVSDTRASRTSGMVYFGVDDDNDPIHKGICGKMYINATVGARELQTNSGDLTDQDLQKASQAAYDSKKLALDAMIGVLSPLAESIVDGTTKVDLTGSKPLDNTGYADLAASAYSDIISGIISNQGAGAGGPAGGGFLGGTNLGGIGGAVNTATGAVAGGFGQSGTNINTDGTISGTVASITDNSQLVKDAIAKGKANGWISAGSFYFIFNRTLIGNLLPTATQELISKEDNDINRIPYCDEICIRDQIALGNGFANNPTMPSYFNSKSINSTTDIKNMAKYLAAASYYMSHDTGTVAPKLDLPSPPGTDTGAAGQVLGIIQEAGTQALEGIMKLTAESGGGDPLLSHAMFGRDIMLICEAAVIAIIIVSMVLFGIGAALSGIPMGAFGVGISALAQGILFLLALVLPVIGMMWTFGAILAIYCPFIPFMIFTVAALGWFLVVVEAIIAAPIIALGLVIPSGDELGRVEPALNILANIFLRPLLLVFGFILAGNVYKAIVQLIDFGMADVLSTVSPVASTPFSIVVLIGVYVFFVLSVTNTSFSLIYAVPDKILRWMGGGHEQTDMGAMQEVKGQVHGVAQGTGSQIQSAGTAAGAGATKRVDAGMKNSFDSSFMGKK